MLDSRNKVEKMVHRNEREMKLLVKKHHIKLKMSHRKFNIMF